ncbi:MAG: hypothetical protein COU69_04675 [Candidatus Pacebacteria bacterium CG10_big_fil_rev_8_21_14_0_10_56_10]|nr:MAG: hypothetical protein COU69_04675 [Candidatus Pacebacteria bacterium CG10_big_fil_rev_8_21_14_0_10_56_10]
MLIIQTLSPVRKFLSSYLKKNPNATLPTLFKQTRGLKSVSLMGDWVLITEIITRCAKKKKFFNKRQVLATCKLSTDPVIRKQRSNSKLVAILTKSDELRTNSRAE